MKQDHAGFAQAMAYGDRVAAEDRVRRFLPMVRRLAWHIYGMGRDGLEIEDLIQAGVVALTECSMRHNGPDEDGFAAYAKIRVRGAMLDLLRRMMHQTRTLQRRRKRYDQAVDALRGELGREPSRAEVARRLKCSDEDLVRLETAQISVSSIADAYDESNSAFADEGPDPFEILAEMEDRERLLKAMEQLPDRLKLVLQLFFAEEMNLTEIAQVLEVSVPRVHQLRARALAELRKRFDETG